VAANAPGAGNPSGTVTFFDGGTSIGQGTLSTTGGVTTARTPPPPDRRAHTSPAPTTATAASTAAAAAVRRADGQRQWWDRQCDGYAWYQPGAQYHGDTGNNFITITQVSGMFQVSGTARPSTAPRAPYLQLRGRDYCLAPERQRERDDEQLHHLGSISINAGTQRHLHADQCAANLIASAAPAPTCQLDGVTTRNDSTSRSCRLTVGPVTGGTRCLDLTIQAQSKLGDNLNIDWKTSRHQEQRGGLTLDDSRGAGNDTVRLKNLSVAYQLSVILSMGTNTLSADHVSSFFGSIYGGPGPNTTTSTILATAAIRSPALWAIE